MTDMEKKIAELDEQGYIKNDSYEVYESASGRMIVQVFTSSWSYEEWAYDMAGNFIEAWEMGIDSEARKIC